MYLQLTTYNYNVKFQLCVYPLLHRCIKCQSEHAPGTEVIKATS